MPSNYFDWFGLPQQYHLDTRELRKRFLERSRALHPDHNAEASAGAGLLDASENNVAYKTLLDPEKRLAHMLLLAGLLNEGEKSQQQLPPTFLMEMMELNEAVDEATAESRTSVEQQVNQHLSQLNEAIDGHMQQHDAASPNERVSHLQAALELHLKRRYILRLLQKLRNLAG